MRLTRKFLAGIVTIIVVVLGAAAGLTIRSELALYDDEIRADHVALGRALSASAAVAMKHEGRPLAEKLLEAAAEAARQRRGGRRPRSFEIRELPAGAEPYGTAEDGDQLVTYVPIDGTPGLAIRISEPVSTHDLHEAATVRRWLYAALALAIAATVVVWLLVRNLVARPLQSLTDHARRIGHGDLRPDGRVTQVDELGELAAEMNEMCGRLTAANLRIAEEAERRIATTNQLRHADRLGTVGQLAAGVAHELGTPLNVVQGRAHLILGEHDPPAMHQNARVIVSQVERMTRIIRQLLDFSRRRPTQSDSCDATSVVRQTVDLVRSMATKSNVEVAVESNGQVLVHVDSGLLSQVVANLLVNAVHACSGRHGHVRVRVHCEEAMPPADSCGERKRYPTIEVEDDGAGIARENLERVFEPFFTTKEVGEGTGLGLSLAYGIVRDFKGWIEVTSELGRGSRFVVRLPPSTNAGSRPD